ncbi:hypothetical protein AN958_07092 [Leucoagaricus sp. SymC.cos]|nr:hypothetical protein AN958_07092 [Leucoagaricus sp. SymC.cos]
MVDLKSAWRHWGCVTPKVLANMKKNYTQPSELDGFEGLSTIDKAKVTQAWKVGHVADEDVPETAKTTDGEEKAEQKTNCMIVAVRDEGAPRVNGITGEICTGNSPDRTGSVSSTEIRPKSTPSNLNEAERFDLLLSRLDSLGAKLSSFDQKFNRANGLSAIPPPDPSHLYPLPLPPPEKPPNFRKLFWTRASWQGEKGSYTYLVTAKGKLHSEHNRREILSTARGLWSDSAIKAGWHAKSWSNCGQMMKDLYVFGIERKYPDLTLCANHWKAHQIAYDHYEVWRDEFFRSAIDEGVIAKGGAGDDGYGNVSSEGESTIT